MEPEFFRRVAQSLDSRLDRQCPRPIVVAFSGGGDSLALLLAAAAWGCTQGRPVVAVTVDHQIQPDGAAWAHWCQARAEALGIAHRSVTWEGEKPKSGLAAAARRARHDKIAQTARSLGARVILMGHTADDLSEAEWMRAAGSNVASPRPWSPVPFWPAGRDLFILRPMIALSRAALRESLAQMGETWIEDPANEDLRSLRARARSALAKGTQPGCVSTRADLAPLALPVVDRGAGVLSVDIAALNTVPKPEAIRGLGAALVCAAGGERPARTPQLARLLAQALDGRPFSATLRGARAQSDGLSLWLTREAGEFSRVERPDQALELHQTQVWDGRFSIRARVAGLRVRALKGLGQHLPDDQKAALAHLPSAVRSSLPALIDDASFISCPWLGPDNRVDLECLVWNRFLASAGHIHTEAAIGCVAKLEQRP